MCISGPKQWLPKFHKKFRNTEPAPHYQGNIPKKQFFQCFSYSSQKKRSCLKIFVKIHALLRRARINQVWTHSKKRSFTISFSPFDDLGDNPLPLLVVHHELHHLHDLLVQHLLDHLASNNVCHLIFKRLLTVSSCPHHYLLNGIFLLFESGSILANDQ